MTRTGQPLRDPTVSDPSAAPKLGPLDGSLRSRPCLCGESGTRDSDHHRGRDELTRAKTSTDHTIGTDRMLVAQKLGPLELSLRSRPCLCGESGTRDSDQHRGRDELTRAKTSTDHTIGTDRVLVPQKLGPLDGSLRSRPCLCGESGTRDPDQHRGRDELTRAKTSTEHAIGDRVLLTDPSGSPRLGRLDLSLRSRPCLRGESETLEDSDQHTGRDEITRAKTSTEHAIGTDRVLLTDPSGSPRLGRLDLSLRSRPCLRGESETLEDSDQHRGRDEITRAQTSTGHAIRTRRV